MLFSSCRFLSILFRTKNKVMKLFTRWYPVSMATSPPTATTINTFDNKLKEYETLIPVVADPKPYSSQLLTYYSMFV